MFGVPGGGTSVIPIGFGRGIAFGCVLRHCPAKFYGLDPIPTCPECVWEVPSVLEPKLLALKSTADEDEDANMCFLWCMIGLGMTALNA